MRIHEDRLADCDGYEIVGRRSWETPRFATADARGGHNRGWGVLVCRPPSAKEHADRGLYGTFAIDEQSFIQGSTVGISFGSEPSVEEVLCQLGLACGLSVVQRAAVELGDTLVVAGANWLSQCILLAGALQGAKTACVYRHVEGTRTNGSQEAGALSVDEFVEVGESADSMSRLDSLIEGAIGQVAIVDAAAEPTLFFLLASRLPKMGTLVLARPDAEASLLLDIANVHHRKSARYAYWGRPESVSEALLLSQCCDRAARLFQAGRVPMAFCKP